MIIKLQTQPHRKLSDELGLLLERVAQRPVTLGELIRLLRGRAYLLLVILLSLPFLTPLPLPGLSTPFGLAIAFIAMRLSLGQRPWLPRSLQRRKVPQGFFAKVLALTTRVIRFLERMLKPRWPFMFSSAFLVRTHAGLMLLSALVLLLPLPIPFTNSFPAWVVLLVAGGLLERDGLFIVLGYGVFLAGALYFVFLGEVAERLVLQVLQWLGWN